jgi:Ser/Thr protein kinase RdoA (MazF antagonist)
VIPEITGFDDGVRDELCARFGLAASGTRRLGSLMSFVFADERNVLKIVGQSHRSESQLIGEIDFVEHLAGLGVRVARPLRSRRGRMVERVRTFFGYAFERLSGAAVETWTPDLIEAWGALLAQIHAANADYHPAEIRRPPWHWDEPDYFDRYLPLAPTVLRRRAAELNQWQLALPRDPADFGMIHGDPHHWNLLHHDGQLSLIDFDDCVYGWFVADIAAALYYAVGAADEFGEPDQVAWFRRVRDHLLRGYERVRPRSMDYAARWLPQFLLASTLHDYVETVRLEAAHAPELAFRPIDELARDIESDRWNDPRLW